jgi:hypothetical protein
MRCGLHLICMSVLPRNNSGQRRTTGAGRSQDHRTIWRFPTLSALLYKYSSIPYILFDWTFVIAADGLAWPGIFSNAKIESPALFLVLVTVLVSK